MVGFKKPFVLMTSVPVLVPAAEGVNVILTLQFEAEGKLVGQSFVSANGPVVVMLCIVSGPTPVKVICCG